MSATKTSSADLLPDALGRLELPLHDIAADIAAAPARTAAKRFYRPELDALRFFAFLAVLIHHGPAPAHGFLHVANEAGGFGLSMFFLLSAYLITELLLREREQSGTVAWGLFFTRRALRIWPLYYAALVIGIAIPRALPHHTGLRLPGIAAMFFFVANWFPNLLTSRLLAHLWSISIEEQFYLIWPPIMKFGGKTMALFASIGFIVSAIVWLWFFFGKTWLLWYDTPVEFLFFAAGAIIALVAHGKPARCTSVVTRGALLIAGLLSLAAASQFGAFVRNNAQGITRTRPFVGYAGVVAGCVLIFCAILGISSVPRSLSYLGKISYGLYVFHASIMQGCAHLTLNLAAHPALNMIVCDGLGLTLSILAAHLSYTYFEMPFLKLKQRFEVINSRPA